MRVFVLGATGFIGTHLVNNLLAEKHEVVGLARHAEAFSKFGGRVEVVEGDITKPDSFRGKMDTCDASINLVGLLRQKKSKGLTYERVVVEGTKNWIRECEEAGVKRAVYISALGADPKRTAYPRTKWEAEQALRGADLEWTIFRPSFVVGEDGAVAQFADLMKLKIMPVWGRQDYYFDPVDVADLATAIVRSLKNPKARGRVYSIGGPDRVTYKEMLRTIAKAHGKKPWLVPTPWFLGYLMTALLGWLPFFPATLENLRMLRHGSEAPDHEWAKDFNIEPRPFKASVEAYVKQRSR